VLGFIHADPLYDLDHLRHFLAWAFTANNWFTNASEQLIAIASGAFLAKLLEPWLRPRLARLWHELHKEEREHSAALVSGLHERLDAVHEHIERATGVARGGPVTDTVNVRPEHVYKRGLLPFDPAKHARFMTTDQAGFTLPAAAYPIDKSQGIAEWGMDGNGPDPTLTVNEGQPVGDCGPSAVPSHSNMLTAVLAGLALSQWTMTSDEVVTLYLIYTGGRDVGVDLGDWLLWLLTHTLAGNEVAVGQGAVEGFVAIPLADLDAALAYFDVVIVGVQLNPDADEQFPGTWDIGPGDEPDPEEGHAILYLGAQSQSGPFEWCTWGGNQNSTLAWKRACVQQAFAVTTAAEATSKGFAAQFVMMQESLKAMGGQGETPPTPTPVTPPAPPAPSPTPPVPTPGPTPTELMQVLTDINDARIILNQAHNEPGIDTVSRLALQRADGPIRNAQALLTSYIGSQL
jgi:hypothetical protein